VPASSHLHYTKAVLVLQQQSGRYTSYLLSKSAPRVSKMQQSTTRRKEKVEVAGKFKKE
jgi:hypothetical protein